MSIFEALMLIGFGLAWPFNICKSIKSKTAAGKSFSFMITIEIAYLCGIAHKVFYSFDAVIRICCLCAATVNLIKPKPHLPLKNKIMTKENKKTSNAKYYFAFAAAIILGILNGIYPTSFGIACAEFLSNVFVRLFKFVSVPVIGITICLTIATLGSGKTQKNLWKRTLAYTLSTTVLAAFVAATLYYIFTPENASSAALSATGLETSKSYLDYFITVIPDNPLAPFVQGNVLSVLLIAITTGIAVRYIGEEENKQVFIRFLGAERVLFGVDYPMWSPVEELARFKNLFLTEEEQEQILWKNAASIFGIQPDGLSG